MASHFQPVIIKRRIFSESLIKSIRVFSAICRSGSAYFRWRKIADSNHTDYFLYYPNKSDIKEVERLIDEFMK